ncbi:unnamed protein product [Toxocara canis]|uniref:Uncharacterized protein n=1 Tax=Toxocara canis TaxID=6265 RepID=A0A183V0Y1_TOXCA|nr:unnamed protein product [Toxocara canis]
MAHKKSPQSGLYDTAPSVNFFTRSPDYCSNREDESAAEPRVIQKMSSRLDGVPPHIFDATLRLSMKWQQPPECCVTPRNVLIGSGSEVIIL